MWFWWGGCAPPPGLGGWEFDWEQKTLGLEAWGWWARGSLGFFQPKEEGARGLQCVGVSRGCRTHS